MPGHRKEASQRLFGVAEAQQGFFTAKQAIEAGFAVNTHPYHVQAGNWVREHRGIYRLALFPPADRPDLVLWSLWSRNRNEKVEGVYSHQTALSLHGLSDLNPSRLHMTVPLRFRRNSETPQILVLHRAEVPPADVESTPGFRVTRPLRTLLDLAEADNIETGFLRQALRQALERGLITRRQLRSADISEHARRVLGLKLREVA